MVTSLLELARESSSDKRRELLGRLADLFYNNGHDVVADEQLLTFANVVTRLLRDIDEPDRVDFASRIASSSATPKQIVLSLATDSPSVADPILERSPLLDDDDLVQIASEGSAAQRLAISRRETVAERVTDTLISFDELPVIRSLLDSSGASISETAFERISEQADDTNGLREKICLRGDVPVALAKKLMPHLKEADRLKMHRLIDSNSPHIGDMVRDALPMVSYERVTRAKRRLQIKHLAAMVRDGKVTIDGYVDDLLAGDTLDVALGFAELSQLSERDAANAVLSISPEPLAVLAKSLGVSAELYARVDQRRREKLRLPSHVAALVLTTYAELDREQALRALRFVRVRASVGATG